MDQLGIRILKAMAGSGVNELRDYARAALLAAADSQKEICALDEPGARNHIYLRAALVYQLLASNSGPVGLTGELNRFERECGWLPNEELRALPLSLPAVVAVLAVAYRRIGQKAAAAKYADMITHAPQTPEELRAYLARAL
jgi:hypothetical protein